MAMSAELGQNLRPSPAIVKLPYMWKILEWDDIKIVKETKNM